MKSVLRSLVILAAFLLALSSVTSMAQIAGSDNFNDNSKDTAKWGTDVVSGGASFLETNTRLEYRVATPTGGIDEALRPWIFNSARNSDAFNVILDVFNNVSPSGRSNASIGLVVTSLENGQDSIFIELFRGGPNTDGKGFLAVLSSAAAGGEVQPYTLPTSHDAVTTASVRLSYNPATLIFTAYYDATGSADGFQWEPYGSFGVGAAGGGTTRNSPWQLTQNLGFKVSVGAFSELQVVASGSVYADNFSATTLSANADLSALALSSGTLTPTFASDTTSYTASVSNATTSITVTPTVSQANATVKVNNVTVTSGTASGAIALNVGTNTITTVVTAQDGTTAKTYTVNVVRQSSTALGGTDDFNDNSKDTSKWGTDVISGGATLLEANGRLEYRVATPDAFGDEVQRPWVLNTARATDAFDVILDVFNNASPTGSSYVSVALEIKNLENEEDAIWMDYSRGKDGITDGAGFIGSMSSAAAQGEVLPLTLPTNHPTVTTGCVRLNYNPSTQIFTAFYDTDGSGNGYQWQVYGSFGVGASGGGSTRNSPWQLTQNLGFQIGVAAYSSGQVVGSGSVYADNFSATTLSNNADLSALALSSGTLTPTFASATTSYTASVSNATTSITVTPTVSQANATVKVNNVTVTSGTASGAIALEVGSNTITTVVTAHDGATAKTYTVNVVRQSSTALGGTDDFNDNSKDTSKWGTDVVSGGATFLETNSRLEYLVTSPHGGKWEDIQRPWILNTAGNSDAFDVVLDVTNTGSQSASLGIAVTSLENVDDRIFIELIGGNGFLAVLDTNVINAEGDNEVLPRTNPTGHATVTTGSVRLSYNPVSKVFTAYYDTDGSGNGYQWQVYGSFGVAGSGGSTRNGNWLMTQNLGFQVSITAYSEALAVTSGQIYADNFQAATGLDGWRLATFGTAAASGSTADNADPDKDGVVNLVEYATGLNPSSSSPLSTPLLPASGASIEFYYPRSVAAFAAGTGFVVEWSDTLATNSWSTSGVTQQVQSDNGTLQQVKATLPAGTSGKRFVRLRIVAPGA